MCAQRSWPWDTVAGLGDGSAELAEGGARDFLSAWFVVQNFAIEGVSKGVGGELAVSASGGNASPLIVQTGSGICYGLYINDTVVNNLTTANPAVGTTGRRVVLQTNWAGTGGAGLEARTRLAVITSADGAPAIPALTQTYGTRWEISLATFTITTGGVITLTDDRTFRKSTMMVDTAEIYALAVETAKINTDAVDDTKIRNSAALSVIGRAANSSGDPADIAAGSDNQVLRRSGTALGFGQVATDGIANLAVTSGKIAANAVIAGKLDDGAVDTTARLANDIVDDTKVGNRVPQFYRRQGGSATVWSTPGTNNYTPTAVRMQEGVFSVSLTGGALGSTITITFPVAFAYRPIMALAISSDVPTQWWVILVETFLSASTFRVAYSRLSAPGDETIYVHWKASGPE